MNRSTRRHPVAAAAATDAEPTPIPPKTLETIRAIQANAADTIQGELNAMCRALGLTSINVDLPGGTYTVNE